MGQYNRRFAKPAAQPRDAHRGFAGSEQELSWICSEQYERTLSKALSCSFRGQLLQVQTPGSAGYHLRGAKVTICEGSSGAGLTLLHKAKPLAFKAFERHELHEKHADDKTLELRLEQLRRKPVKPFIPADTHPWRKSYKARELEPA